MKKAAKNLSDKELQGLLASLKEEVAAPSDFRARVLKAVAAERAFDSAKPEPVEGLRLGFRAMVSRVFLRPVLLPLAAAAVFGFVIWFVAKPEVQSPKVRPERGARVEGRAQPSNLALVERAGTRPAPTLPLAPVAIAASPERAGTRPAPTLPLAPVAIAAFPEGAGTRPAPTRPEALASSVPQFGSSGSSAAAAPAAAHAADFSPEPKPTIIIVTPAPTPVLKALSGNSEVRRNKFLASRGEYAAILYALKASQEVRIEIYSRAGALVALLQDGTQAAGQHEIHWFGYDDQGALLPSGIYLLRIHSADYDERHKLVLIR